MAFGCRAENAASSTDQGCGGSATASSVSYFDALELYLVQHCRPVAFYSDKHTVFRLANQAAKSGHGVTRFGRALNELNIEPDRLRDVLGFRTGSWRSGGRVCRSATPLSTRTRGVTHATITEHKCLGAVLEFIKAEQQKDTPQETKPVSKQHRRCKKTGPKPSGPPRASM